MKKREDPQCRCHCFLPSHSGCAVQSGNAVPSELQVPLFSKLFYNAQHFLLFRRVIYILASLPDQIRGQGLCFPHRAPAEVPGPQSSSMYVLYWDQCAWPLVSAPPRAVRGRYGRRWSGKTSCRRFGTILAAERTKPRACKLKSICKVAKSTPHTPGCLFLLHFSS